MIVPLAIRRLDHAPHQPQHATTPRKHLVVTTDREKSEEVRSSAANGDYDRLEEAIKDILSRFSELNRSHYSLIADAGYIVDVRIGSRGLAENIFLEDRTSYADIYPFMGGEIDVQDVNVVEYRSARAGESVFVTLILSQPDLTELERSVLAALPGDRGAVVGDGVVAAVPAVWAVARGAWAAYQVGKYLYKEHKQWKARRAQVGRTQAFGGSESFGVEIPEHASVAQLLEARGLALQKQFGGDGVA